MKQPTPPMDSGFSTFRSIALGSVVVAATAMATPLGLGTTVKLHGTTAAANPALKGTVFKDVKHPIVLNIPGGAVPGVFHERVVKEAVAGTLDFYFSIETSKPLQTAAMGVDLTGFRDFTTDVEYRTDGEGATGPSKAFRPKGGDTILFSFQSVTVGTAPAHSTREAYVKTNAKALATGGTASIAVSGEGFTPTLVNTFKPQ